MPNPDPGQRRLRTKSAASPETVMMMLRLVKKRCRREPIELSWNFEEERLPSVGSREYGDGIERERALQEYVQATNFGSARLAWRQANEWSHAQGLRSLMPYDGVA